MNIYNKNMGLKCCACCGEFTLAKGNEGEVCSICGWTKDIAQEKNPRIFEGRNKKSLNDAQHIYFAHRRDHSIF